MAVPCFTREERNGMFVIQPLEGRMALDCMIVNGTAHSVYQRIAAGMPFEQLVDGYVSAAMKEVRTELDAAKNLDPSKAVDNPNLYDLDEERIRFDLYRILLALRDREVCDYTFDNLLDLLPSGDVVKGATQVMPLSMVHKTNELLGEVIKKFDATPANGKAETESPDPAANGSSSSSNFDLLFSFPSPTLLGDVYFTPEGIVRRHLDQAEVYFIAVDEAGEVEACTLIQGLQFQPATLTVSLCAARYDSAEEFENRVGIHLSRLFGLLQVSTLSAKVRMQFGEKPPYGGHRHERYDSIIGELGFRRAFLLENEMEQGSGLIAYDRPLF